MIDTTSRIQGGLLGVAAGDALGATLEFCSPAAVAAEYGRHTEIIGGGAFGWRPGQGTDDTDLTACVARAYASGFTLAEAGHRMVDWHRGRPRDIGGTTAHPLKWLVRHDDPERSGHVAAQEIGSGGSAGNGSLMRALPTALARADQPTRIREAIQISQITHSDPRCVQACVAYVEIAAALLKDSAALAAITTARAACDSWTPEIEQALTINHTVRVETLSTGGYVIDSLAAAVWAIQQPAPLEDILIDVVNRGDDADTTGAIVGGLLGVRDGLNAIPQRWRQLLEYGPELMDLATTLAALRRTSEHSPDSCYDTP